ncbi:MAG: MBL fold metallo-hydrolase [Synergistaceae bacterium]|nr:MBL fold metallo-hydrolase [Synergistaceae bacterium]
MRITAIALLAVLFVFVCKGAARAESGEIFSVAVGDLKISMILEAQRDSGLDFLIGASPEDIAKFIPSGSYPSVVAAYLVQSPDGAMLVDTGFGREIGRHLKSLGVSDGDIKTVLVTHAHGDHISGLAKDGKAVYKNAKVIAAKGEYAWSADLRKHLRAYDGRHELITPGGLETGGTEIRRGVYAIEAYGHTPGHTMFLFESKGEKLLIWGDLTHAMAIQMPRPGVSVTYDSDPAAAAEVRASVLKYAAENKIPIAGMHVAYPGIGDISADPENPGGYIFTGKTE